MTEPRTPVPTLLVERTDGVLTLTLNAPEVRNSLGAPGLQDALLEGLAELERDPKLGAMVITGAGGNFSSGGDLRKLGELTEAELRDRMSYGAWVYRRIALIDKPIIAAVEGAAFGAGLGLAACCDFVVAARSARFCAAFARVGAMPDAALFWSLPLRVGVTRARNMMCFAEEVSAAAGLASGLVDRIAEDGAACAEAQRLAGRMAAGPTRVFGKIKAGLRRAPMSIEDALAFQIDNAPPLFASADFKEGANAFLEKRKPVFRGR